MAVIINGVVIMIAALLGNQLNVSIPTSLQRSLMQAVGLSVLAIGLVSLNVDGHPLILIASMVAGAFIGSWFNLDAKITQAIERLEVKIRKSSSSTSWAQGFLAGTMMLCVGSMSIVGALELGLSGNPATLYTKTVLDGISSFLMASTLGIGVAGASLPVLVLEGGLALSARYLAPYLSPFVVDNMVFIGAVLLIALAFNLLEVLDVKVMNFILAIFMPIIINLFI